MESLTVPPPDTFSVHFGGGGIDPREAECKFARRRTAKLRLRCLEAFRSRCPQHVPNSRWLSHVTTRRRPSRLEVVFAQHRRWSSAVHACDRAFPVRRLWNDRSTSHRQRPAASFLQLTETRFFCRSFPNFVNWLLSLSGTLIGVLLLTYYSYRTTSASTSALVVPYTRLSTVGERAFPVAASCGWNSLPLYITLQRHLYGVSRRGWNRSCSTAVTSTTAPRSTWYTASYFMDAGAEGSDGSTNSFLIIPSLIP